MLEQRYKLLADYSYDWEYWILADGTLEYVSPSCQRISGYSADQFKQDPGLLLEIVHPSDKAAVSDHFRDELLPKGHLTDDYQELDFRIISHNGETRWLSHACRPVYDEQGSFLGVRVSQRDITERNRKEIELRTLQMAAQNVAAAIVITDLQGNIEYVNRRFTELTGYSKSEVIGKNPRLLKDPSTPAQFYRELWDTITSGRSWKGTFHNVKKDGSYYWEVATVSPVFDAGGEIISFVAVKEDITERLHVDEVLRESEAKFRRLVEKTPMPLCFFNQAGNIGYINERFVELFGYTVADLPTVAEWWGLAYPDEKYRNWVKDNWQSAIEQAFKAGSDIQTGEYSVTCKDGTVRLVLIQGIIMDDSVFVGFTDITDRRRQERLLKAAYERKQKNEIMNELVAAKLPSKRTLAASTRLLGMKVIAPFNCFVVVINSFQGKKREEYKSQPEQFQAMIDSMIDELADEFCITWESHEGIGVLWYDSILPMDQKKDQEKQALQLGQMIARLQPELKVAIGISERAQTLHEISAYYMQASIAVEVGRKIWPEKQVFHYLDIGLFQLLPYIHEQEQVDTYIERVLGKLLHHEKRKRAEYLTTLELIIVSDNLKLAAAQLTIHYKTLMFRKQRLEQILGISLDDFRNRMTVFTAIQLLKLRESSGE